MSNQLIDPFGREVNYLRVSVTDRCDFRCTYCMSENMTFLPKKDILSLEELEIICNVFIKLGTKKIRLTGGEPLVRKGILNLIKNLGKKIGNGLDELTLTTNGSQLERYAEFLKENGVNRVNVSLDHLDPNKFSEITRWGDLDKVLVGIEKAKSVGIKVKINMVALKDFNEKNIIEMIEWCSLNGYDMTLIEVMPMGDIGSENRFNQYLPLSKIKERKIHTKSPTVGTSPKQIVFLLHGYGADGADLIDLSSPFSMVLPYAKFISPDAPFDCKMSPMGKEWFPIEEIPNGAINASNELLSLIKQECNKESLKFEDVLLIGFFSRCNDEHSKFVIK